MMLCDKTLTASTYRHRCMLICEVCSFGSVAASRLLSMVVTIVSPMREGSGEITIFFNKPPLR